MIIQAHDSSLRPSRRRIGIWEADTMKRTIFALILVTAAGCYNEKVAVRSYIDEAIGLTETFLYSGVTLGTTIGPWLNGEPVNIGEVKRAYESFSQGIKNASTRIREMRCPNNKLALALQKELLAYLDFEEEFAGELSIVCDTIENNNPADPRTIQVTLSRVQALMARESALRDRLNTLAGRAGNQW